MAVSHKQTHDTAIRAQDTSFQPNKNARQNIARGGNHDAKRGLRGALHGQDQAEDDEHHGAKCRWALQRRRVVDFPTAAPRLGF